MSLPALLDRQIDSVNVIFPCPNGFEFHRMVEDVVYGCGYLETEHFLSIERLERDPRIFAVMQPMMGNGAEPAWASNYFYYHHPAAVLADLQTHPVRHRMIAVITDDSLSPWDWGTLKRLPIDTIYAIVDCHPPAGTEIVRLSVQ